MSKYNIFIEFSLFIMYYGNPPGKVLHFSTRWQYWLVTFPPSQSLLIGAIGTEVCLWFDCLWFWAACQHSCFSCRWYATAKKNKSTFSPLTVPHTLVQLAAVQPDPFCCLRKPHSGQPRMSEHTRSRVKTARCKRAVSMTPNSTVPGFISLSVRVPFPRHGDSITGWALLLGHCSMCVCVCACSM